MKTRREANLEFMRRRQKRLLDNSAALGWLKNLGLKDEIVSLFGLGLSEIYIDKQSVEHRDALLAPVLNQNGIFTSQTVYLNIPNVTINPADGVMWTKGSPQTYCAEKYGGQAFVVVCGDVFDLWLTAQALRENKNGSNLLLICSTPNDSGKLPEEWKKLEFWERFETIYLGFHNSAAGDRQAMQIAESAGGNLRRLRPAISFGESWARFWQDGGTLKEFFRLFSEANLIGPAIISDAGSDNTPGRFGYKPVDITTAFHRGHLYYPVRTTLNALETIKESGGNQMPRLTSRLEVVLVRSDRTIHTISEAPAPRGTPPENRVLRLSDGTLVASLPVVSEHSNWDWDSIEAYRQKRSRTRSLKMILREVKDFLKKSVWLPYRYDYDLLTLLVPATYAQAVFQAVPLVVGDRRSRQRQERARKRDVPCLRQCRLGGSKLGSGNRPADSRNERFYIARRYGINRQAPEA
jgi:hypothetical protein